MRLNPDTKDALLFMTGLLGMVSQGALYTFGIGPSYVLCGSYLTMCGLGVGFSILGGRPSNGDDGHDPPDDEAPRKRKARRQPSISRKPDGS